MRAINMILREDTELKLLNAGQGNQEKLDTEGSRHRNPCPNTPDTPETVPGGESQERVSLPHIRSPPSTPVFKLGGESQERSSIPISRSPSHAPELYSGGGDQEKVNTPSPSASTHTPESHGGEYQERLGRPITHSPPMLLGIKRERSRETLCHRVPLNRPAPTPLLSSNVSLDTQAVMSDEIDGQFLQCSGCGHGYLRERSTASREDSERYCSVKCSGEEITMSRNVEPQKQNTYTER